MEARRSQPDLHTMDRALQQMQQELASLRAQLSERSTSETRQRYPGDNRGGFAETERGPLQADHELTSQDFRPAIALPHTIVRAVKPLEITEAWWYPAESWTANATNYSWIELRSRNMEGRRLGYISGQPKTAGPYATGDLIAGSEYKLDLVAQPRLVAGQSVTLVTRAQTNPGVWPPGAVIVCWRWL
jgi:hypothetical protein